MLSVPVTSSTAPQHLSSLDFDDEFGDFDGGQAASASAMSAHSPGSFPSSFGKPVSDGDRVDAPAGGLDSFPSNFGAIRSFPRSFGATSSAAAASFPVQANFDGPFPDEDFGDFQ